MGNNFIGKDTDHLKVYTTDWRKTFAYFPVKLSNNKWIWWKSFYIRKSIILSAGGIGSQIEMGDIFYMMQHTEKGVTNALYNGI